MARSSARHFFEVKFFLMVTYTLIMAVIFMALPRTETAIDQMRSDEELVGRSEAAARAAKHHDLAVYSSKLGWSEGDNITNEMANVLKREVRVGGVLVLENMFSIDAGAQIIVPDGKTISADSGGGIDIIGTAGVNVPAIMLGNGSALENLRITASDAPSTEFEGQKPTAGVDYHQARAVGIFGAEGATVTGVSFSGNLAMFLDVRDSSKLLVDESHFQGGFSQVRLMGHTNDANIKRSHFEDSLGDGIKTERSGMFGPQRARISENFFEANNRDGIDTAGGLKDSTIRDNVFFANSQALDLKVVLERVDDLSPEISNSGLLIERGQIIDSRNAIVLTYLDRIGVTTAENADNLMPHDITVRDVVFENSQDFDRRMRAFLIKDGHSVRWEGLVFLGDIDEVSIRNDANIEDWLSHNIGGEVAKTGPPRRRIELLELLNRYR